MLFGHRTAQNVYERSDAYADDIAASESENLSHEKIKSTRSPMQAARPSVQ